MKTVTVKFVVETDEEAELLINEIAKKLAEKKEAHYNSSNNKR